MIQGYKSEYDRDELIYFLQESNRIEGIHGAVANELVVAAEEFLVQEMITSADIQQFVSVCQPGAVLRFKTGWDVRVGDHVPPAGGPRIKMHLDAILDDAMLGNTHPYFVHCSYETLHPFSDGNGRSGRILWAWQMVNQGWSGWGLRLGFLHAHYYHSLQFAKDRSHP